MIHRTPFLVVALLCLLVIPALGQGNAVSSEAHHRNQCRLATQVLTTGQPEGKRAWAQDYITACGDEGPAVLARQWLEVGDDSAQVVALVIGSPRIRDARIYNTMRTIVEDPNRPERVRVGAMIVLAKYVDPQIGIGYPDLRAPSGEIRRIPLVLNWLTHGGQIAGTHPLPGPVGQEVLATLQRVAARRDTEDRAVWYAAAVLARRIEMDRKYGRGQ